MYVPQQSHHHHHRVSSQPVSQEAEVEGQDGEQKLMVMFERK